MALYDFLKDLFSAAQKTQNIELLQAILEAQRQAWELQAENAELKKRIEELQDMHALEERIMRNPVQAYVMLTGDEDNIVYCSVCYDSNRQLIQMKFIQHIGPRGELRAATYECHVCKNQVHTTCSKQADMLALKEFT
ncbi:MAG: SIKE family protein [Oscillospiraceae bacterium]|nr:SIKE family protein [Oscillospiraceae bacterium]